MAEGGQWFPMDLDFRITQEIEDTSVDDRYIHYLDWNNGFMGVYMYQNLQYTLYIYVVYYPSIMLQ